MLKEKGFTLVEVLLTCLLFPVVLTLIIAILNVMVLHQFPKLSQNDLFKVQLYQLLSRSKITECSERLMFSHNLHQYEIIEDKKRIIKTPGYEILMFDIDHLYFEDSDGYCSIFYNYKGDEMVIDIEKE